MKQNRETVASSSNYVPCARYHLQPRLLKEIFSGSGPDRDYQKQGLRRSLRHIHKLLSVTYEFGISPLPQLRKIFWEYEWRFHGDARRTLVFQAHDFLWPVWDHWYDIQCASRWVTATRKRSGITPFTVIGVFAEDGKEVNGPFYDAHDNSFDGAAPLALFYRSWLIAQVNTYKQLGLVAPGWAVSLVQRYK